MATRARHVNSESAASERLMRDALEPGSIDEANETLYAIEDLAAEAMNR